MNTIIENYNNVLNKNYYTNLKIFLTKNKNNKFNKYLDDVINDSDDEITSTQSISTSNNITILSETVEDYYYKKQWNKLNIIHKKIKIKEFINNLMIQKEEKKKLINNLMKLVNDKKLIKKNDIEYDVINGKIISIPILKCNNNKYYI
jgi:hypothetical protein